MNACIVQSMQTHALLISVLLLLHGPHRGCEGRRRAPTRATTGMKEKIKYDGFQYSVIIEVTTINLLGGNSLGRSSWAQAFHTGLDRQS